MNDETEDLYYDVRKILIGYLVKSPDCLVSGDARAEGEERLFVRINDEIAAGAAVEVATLCRRILTILVERHTTNVQKLQLIRELVQRETDVRQGGDDPQVGGGEAVRSLDGDSAVHAGVRPGADHNPPHTRGGNQMDERPEQDRPGQEGDGGVARHEGDSPAEARIAYAADVLMKSWLISDHSPPISLCVAFATDLEDHGLLKMPEDETIQPGGGMISGPMAFDTGLPMTVDRDKDGIPLCTECLARAIGPEDMTMAHRPGCSNG